MGDWTNKNKEFERPASKKTKSSKVEISPKNLMSAWEFIKFAQHNEGIKWIKPPKSSITKEIAGNDQWFFMFFPPRLWCQTFSHHDLIWICLGFPWIPWMIIYIYILMKWPWYPHGQTHVRCLCGRWRKLFLEKHRYGIQMHSECRLPWWVSLPGQGLGRILTLSSKCNKNLMTFEGMVSHVRRLRFLKPFWFYPGEQIPRCSDLSSLLPGRGRMCTRWNRCLGDWSGAPSIGSFWW